MLYYNVLYFTRPYCILDKLFDTVRYYTTDYCRLHYIPHDMPHTTYYIPHSTTRRYIISCYTWALYLNHIILTCIALCNTILYVLYYIMLYYNTLHHTTHNMMQGTAYYTIVYFTIHTRLRIVLRILGIAAIPYHNKIT